MELSREDKDYILEFKDRSEQMFFVNSVNLSFQLLEESIKNSQGVSKVLLDKIKKMIKYHSSGKFLRVIDNGYCVREEYIKILFENTQTVLMIALKEKSLPDLHINQYEYIDSFLNIIFTHLYLCVVHKLTDSMLFILLAD